MKTIKNYTFYKSLRRVVYFYYNSKVLLWWKFLISLSPTIPSLKIHFNEKHGIICTTFRYLKCSDLFPIFLSKTTLFQLNFFFCTKLIIFLNQTPRSSSTPVKLGNVYKWYLISIYLQGVCLKNICVGNLAIEKYLHQVDNTSKRSLSLPVL